MAPNGLQVIPNVPRGFNDSQAVPMTLKAFIGFGHESEGFQRFARGPKRLQGFQASPRTPKGVERFKERKGLPSVSKGFLTIRKGSQGIRRVSRGSKDSKRF